uniref:Uncharacterized protein n=1 Tax=Cairina moschata TaxID=8855 RepID=A0A8C3BX03_CAIMO
MPIESRSSLHQRCVTPLTRSPPRNLRKVHVILFLLFIPYKRNSFLPCRLAAPSIHRPGIWRNSALLLDAFLCKGCGRLKTFQTMQERYCCQFV